jgi:translation elongation factor EF-4
MVGNHLHVLRVGVQGLLHVEIFRQRLTDEFGIKPVVTPPKVPYTITFLPSQKNQLEESYTKIVEDLSEWPDAGERYQVDEASCIHRCRFSSSLLDCYVFCCLRLYTTAVLLLFACLPSL